MKNGKERLLNISIEKYHADTKRISSSGLRLIHRSPAHYYAAYLDPDRKIPEPTPEMLLGTYTHCAVFEPDRFSKEHKDMGITPENLKKIEGMRKSVMNHPLIKILLGGYDGIAAEKTIYFTDTESGARCKMRPDGIKTYPDGYSVIIELKTCQNALPDAFGQQALKYGYYNQAAFYVNGYMAAGLSDNRLEHLFIAVENTPPYACTTYITPEYLIQQGSRENVDDLKTYVKCLKTRNWPGYDSVMELNSPIQSI